MPSLGRRASRVSYKCSGRRHNAGEEDLAAVSGIGPSLAARFVRKRVSFDAAGELRRVAAVGARVLTWLGAGYYPARPEDLHDAPSGVYLRVPGTAPLDPAVAIVGTRRPSPYGRDVAGGLGEALGEAGVVIISGLVRGINRAAPAGALRRGRKTVARCWGAA
jgi:DNA processing protein